VNVSLYQAASALNAGSRWQEVISENLASSSIPGYKKQDLSFTAVQAGLMPRGASGNAPAFTLPRVVTTTNFQPGELQMTGSNTDVAIDGPGFFVVQMANGASAYTRDGEFQMNAQGQLTSKQGYPVLGDAGPIQLNLNDTTPISISATGVVSQGPEVKGKLRVVDFQQPQLLTAAGGGYFLAQNAALVPNEVAQPSVRQGFLEGSNTTSVGEMANLITGMRSFEANQRVIQLQDDRMSRAISELSGTN
jgi:flagellar basal body rod protein FlgG